MGKSPQSNSICRPTILGNADFLFLADFLKVTVSSLTYFLIKSYFVWRHETFPTLTVISYVYATILDHVMNYTARKHVMWQPTGRLSPYRALVQTSRASTNSSTYSETESCLSFLGNKKGWIAMSVQNYAVTDLQQNASGFRCPCIFWEYKSNNTLYHATQSVCESFLGLCECFQVWLVLRFTK